MSIKYTEEFKNTIVELYKSDKLLAELNAEYGIPKLTISAWSKENLSVVSTYEGSITLK